jgi:hypothetical protein
MIASAVATGMPAPGSRGLRGFNNGKGTKWNVRYTVFGHQKVSGKVMFTGPVHLMNNGTISHWIAPRNSAWGGRTSRVTGNLVGSGKGAHALYFPDGEVRWGPVFHPGTRGKKFFERAEPIIVRQSERIIKQEVRSHLARAFT